MDNTGSIALVAAVLLGAALVVFDSNERSARRSEIDQVRTDIEMLREQSERRLSDRIRDIENVMPRTITTADGSRAMIWFEPPNWQHDKPLRCVRWLNPAGAIEGPDKCEPWAGVWP